jgi:hypothetical protein
MNEKIFKEDAKQIVDLCFDTNIFKESLTRDDMNAIQDYIESSLQSRLDSYKKIDSLMKKINKLPTND